MSIIEVKHVTKEFRLGAMQGLRDSVVNGFTRLAGGQVAKRTVFKALDDVSFSVEQGEVLGIIGHNGAGKSTLLKMLAKISNPTTGAVQVRGRVAPLIEVWAGFIPDFTGRENVYLNGSILGMSKKEIDRKFDEIVDFAEMWEFIDTPVKRYSSGMQVKLAFAVATSVESEVLIVDEVLAVGDLAFQRKCYDRVEQFVQRRDRTILLVSHNLRQVERLCSRVILLEKGRIFSDGNPSDACNTFFQKSNSKIASDRSTTAGRYQGSADFELHSVLLLSGDAAVDHIETNDDVTIEARFIVKTMLRDPNFTVGIHTTDLFFIGVTDSDRQLKIGSLQPGEYVLRCSLPCLPLAPGVYAIHFSVDTGSAGSPLFSADNVINFQVDAPSKLHISASERLGVLYLQPDWQPPELVVGSSD